MPSPFPGMDPFIELAAWSNFHFDFIAQIKRDLQPRLAPHYLIDTETRVYIETTGGETSEYIPDLSLRPRSGSAGTSESAPAAIRAVAASATPVAQLEPEEYLAPWPQEHREPYLLVRDAHKHEVVTVLELLSPTNKRRGSVGSQEYSAKRAEFLAARVNLVEIDLLRGGARLALDRPYKDDTDYCVLLFRRQRRASVLVYQWPLRHPLPVIPIPLSDQAADAPLDLQAQFSRVYDELTYALRLPYDQPLLPPPRPSDAAWVQALLPPVG